MKEVSPSPPDIPLPSLGRSPPHPPKTLMYLASSKVAACTLAAISAAVTSFISLTPVASAQSLGAASEYNAFVFGNFTSAYTDTEGRLAVGGNANLTGYGVGNKVSPAGGNVLVVGGSLTANSGQLYNGTGVYGTTATTSSFTGSLSKGSPVNFSAAQSYLTGLSGQLAGTSSNGNYNNHYGTLQFVGTDANLNTFAVSGTAVSSANGIQITAPNSSTVVINIGGTTVDFRNFGFTINNTDKQHVIYNFYQATTLNISGISVQGSILAPLADVSFGNGNIEGTLIAKSMSGSGEFHNYKFLGTLPVPEPSGVVLASLGALFFLGFRRRK